ncbi:MAG: HNH endonuclease [Bacteroidales bacterium]|nr:HNH endonuclease [Bacteroidales bacterium]
MKRVKYNIEDIRKAAEENLSIAGVLRQLGLRPVGGNYKTIKKLISENNIDISHFTGQGWNVGLAFKPQKAIENKDIFIENSNYTCSWRLRERYKRLKHISFCESCGLSEWMEKPIPLEIHHINGVNTDNRLENLQLICPNCHALTKYYRGRAALSARSEKREVECRKFKEALTGKADGNLEPSLQNMKEGAETRHDTPKTKVKVKE